MSCLRFFRELLQLYQRDFVASTARYLDIAWSTTNWSLSVCWFTRFEELRNTLQLSQQSNVQAPLEVLQEVMQNQYKYLWSVAGELKAKLDSVEAEKNAFLHIVAPEFKEQVADATLE